MKTLKITILLIVAVTMSVTAQEINDVQQKKTQPRFGIKGGLNVANEGTISHGAFPEYRIGLHLGGFMEYAVSNKVDIQPELLYSMQGGRFGDNTLKLDYINIPVIFKIYVNQARRFSIDVGPKLGYMINAKIAFWYGTVDLSDYSDYNKIDGAVCLGASYKFNPNFHINLRGNIGVTKIESDRDDVNWLWQLGIGYVF